MNNPHLEGMVVEYRFRPDHHTTEANPEQIIILYGNNGAFTRSNAYKKMTDMFTTRFLTRPLHPNEISYVNKSRFTFTKYCVWEALIKDDTEILGKEDPFIDKLKEFAKKYELNKRSRRAQIQREKSGQLPPLLTGQISLFDIKVESVSQYSPF